MALTFSFKKKIKTKLIGPARPAETHDVEDFELSNSPTKSDTSKAELVIPLIKKNVYRFKADRPLPAAKVNDNDALEDEAAKEIIRESKLFLEKPTVEEQNFDDLSIPLVLKNKVPGGYETGGRFDVRLRPDNATEAQYNHVPVAAFGVAVVRGMGWTPEVGIDTTSKQNTEQIARPKVLGLGLYAASVPGFKKGNFSKISEKSGEKEHRLEHVKGANVLVTSGLYKNKYGTILGIDIDTDRFIVKLAIGGKTEQISRNRLKPVGQKEYDNNAKDLSRLSKAYVGKSITPTIIDDGNTPVIPENKVVKRERSRKCDDIIPKPEEKRRKKEDIDKSSKKRSSDKIGHQSPETKSRNVTWVRPQIHVRIIDKTYRKGRYYREKVVIEDVLGQGQCYCRTKDGKILDDIRESMLETVIPKSSSDAYVIIVRSCHGKYNGKLAKILEKDKDSREAHLQMIEDRDVVVKVHFEDMCEFTGDPEQHAMF